MTEDDEARLRGLARMHGETELMRDRKRTDKWAMRNEAAAYHRMINQIKQRLAKEMEARIADMNVVYEAMKQLTERLQHESSSLKNIKGEGAAGSDTAVLRIDPASAGDNGDQGGTHTGGGCQG